jgi:hypothetical protein
MHVSARDLRRTYESKTTSELLDLSVQGTLTSEAQGVVEEMLLELGVSREQQHSILRMARQKKAEHRRVEKGSE